MAVNGLGWSRWGGPVGTIGGGTAPAHGTSIGAPGFWTGIIPVYGSLRSSINDFQTGHPFLGTFNGIMAISDVFLVKAAAVAVGKIAVAGAVKLLAEDVAE